MHSLDWSTRLGVPRAGLSTERLVEEAARLVDEEGRAGLTLSALAKRFGVAQPSVYKHVTGLDGLNQLLAVQVLQELGEAMRRASTGKAGPDAVSAIATAYRKYAVAHPGRYEYALRAPGPGDDDLAAAAAEVLSIFDAVFAGFGITGPDAIDADRFFRSVLHGFVSLELGGGFGLSRSADHSFGRLVSATNRALADW